MRARPVIAPVNANTHGLAVLNATSAFDTAPIPRARGPVIATTPASAFTVAFVSSDIPPKRSAADRSESDTTPSAELTVGRRSSPSVRSNSFNSAIACWNWNAVVCDTCANASSTAPVVSVMLAKIASVVATFAPIKSRTPDRARMFPKTDAAAASFPANSSERVLSVAKRPSSRSWVRRPSDDRPISVRASSACLVGRRRDDRMPRTCVAASAAFVPVRDRAANAAPTSLKLTPIAEASGRTRPIDPASSVVSNLPSRIVAVITSVACAAERTSAP